MKQEIIPIELSEHGEIPHLSDIYPEGLPEGIILNKTICGLGATYSCIKKPCHTIIIELNLPVIQGKMHAQIHEEDNLFAVFGDTKTEDIIAYLVRSNRNQKFIKVLCTPESYYKLEDAMVEVMGDTFHSKVFCVLDEIHKYVLDDGYRDFKLGEIIEEFWKYEKRSVISATPLLSDDPRYEETDMREIVVSPQWEYKRPLQLVISNDVSQSLTKVFGQYQDRMIFVACNSVKLIRTYIEETQVARDSVIFCAKETAQEISHENVLVCSDWNANALTRINWLTSRFWTGFDLDNIPDPPVLIMLTDSQLVEHTMIYPSIDAVQIVGRFRQGVSEIIHITNTNPNFKYRTTEHIKGYQEAQKEAYSKINAMMTLNDNNELREALREILKACPWSRNLNGSFEVNYLAVAYNAHKLVVQSAYSSMDSIIEAYQSSPFIINVREEIYDERVIEIKRMPGRWRQRRQMLELLDKTKEFDKDNGEHEQLLREFGQIDRWLIDAYQAIGSDEIRKCHYRTGQINYLISKVKSNRQKLKTEVINLVKSSFHKGEKHTRREIKLTLSAIYKGFNVEKAPTATDIKSFFQVKECKVKGESAFYLIEPLF